MEQDIGTFGELVLGRPGVALMTDLWCVAVGLSVLPLRSTKDWRFVVPGPLVALLLVTVWPRHWFVFILTLVTTALVMGAGMCLIAAEERKNLVRGWLLVLAGLGLMQVTPRLPEGYGWLATPLVPVVMFGVPVGLVLLAHALVQRRRWWAPILSTVSFAGAWVVWMTRDYFYRLKY